MIGWGFQFLWLVFEIVLTDLSDLRYNNERTIHFIPGVSFSWSGKDESMIAMVNFTFFIYELSFIMFNLDYWIDKLEDKINDVSVEEDKNDEE